MPDKLRVIRQSAKEAGGTLESDVLKKLASNRGIISDVDGTLRESGTSNPPSDRVRGAFNTWRRERGPENSAVSIITNSPRYKTEHLIRFLGLKGPQVNSGGAEIVDAESGKIISNHPINKGVALDLCRKLIIPTTESGGKLWIQDNGEDFDPLDPNYKPQYPYIIVIDAIPEAYAKSLMEELKAYNDIAAHRVILPPGQDHREGIHITHRDATKYHAVMEISELVNIPPERLLGIGDGPNDIPLFEACGVNVAVRKDDGSVVKILEEQADFIAPSMKNDGVAVFLETVHRIFKNK